MYLTLVFSNKMKGLLIVLSVSVRLSRPKYTSLFYTYVSVCAQSYAQPCKVYFIWLSWPSGARKEQLWILQCDEGHGRKTQNSGKHSRKASRDQVLLQATIWEAGPCLSLFRRCVKPYVYAVFLRLPCESIPPWQPFHLVDKLITAREFNAHVRPARTKWSILCPSVFVFMS